VFYQQLVEPMHQPEQHAVLDFWFGSPAAPIYGQPRSEWFQKNTEFDRKLGDLWRDCYQQALEGKLEDWGTTAEGCLALILLFDQFPRNVFRETPQAFATDPLARHWAQVCLDQGWEVTLLPVQRWFVYLPFEHSEDLVDQERAIALFEQLRHHPASLSTINYAYRHWEVIRRFGRFPHRNVILGRPSTPEEQAFLQDPGSRF
jgi:uncharacterized protein (DUF924 family)